ncbi:MAG TPA: helix-turn-helix domain-containing protein [Actinospica sp.]|nr:helix-turn-helix domain-containing protein [Actinospica sp.]
MVIDERELACIVLALDGSSELSAPFLVAVAARPVPPELTSLLADATSILSLCWRLEHAQLQEERLRTADARTREAVLHLLMNGHVTAARQVAGALLPALPDALQVYVIEGPSAKRGAAAQALAGAADGAWIVPCPVYADHLLVLAPAAVEGGAADAAWPRAVTSTCWIGVSDAVTLRDTATGYAQAFHALAAARQRVERHASFAGHPDLALTIGPAATAWAESFLAPLLAYRARRSQDPDSAVLLATAASWLSFSSRATAHLKIHRNTLTARLALIRELLGVDLDQIGNQAELALALRALAAHGRPRPDAAPSLDELLALPHVVAWAERQFRPLRGPEAPECVEETLTTWLRLDARMGPTAQALSLSASAVRKRLARGEALLQRSLLRSPSAVYDLWLALRALESSPRVPR